MAAGRRQKWPDRRLWCRRCNAPTAHVVLFEEAITGELDWMSWWKSYRVVRCRGCDNIGFEKTEADTETFDPEGNVAEQVEVFPNPRERGPMRDDETMPWQVQAIYHETLRAFSNDMLMLTALGVRTLVQTVCRERGCKRAALSIEIDELVARAVIPQALGDLLHEIRFLGNDAAHELPLVRSSELSEAIDAVEVVLRAVYVSPALKERLQRHREHRRGTEYR